MLCLGSRTDIFWNGRCSVLRMKLVQDCTPCLQQSTMHVRTSLIQGKWRGRKCAVISSRPAFTITANMDSSLLCPSRAEISTLKSLVTSISTPKGCWLISATTRSRVKASFCSRYQPTTYQRYPPIAIWKLKTFGSFCWCAFTTKHGDTL